MDFNKLFFSFSLGYVLLFIIPYSIVPLIFAYSIFPEYVVTLTLITLLSIFAYLAGLNFGFGIHINTPKLLLNFDLVIYSVFLIFIILISIIMITSNGIPIIAAINGVAAEDLSILREDFLKARSGWEASLNYLISLINGAILPFLISVSFFIKHKNRYAFALLFLLYCISFLEKAYFLKLAIPLFFIYFFQVKNKFGFVLKGLGIIVFLLFIMFALTATQEDRTNDEGFFSIYYLPTGTLDSLLWRSLVVPIVTALDGIRVFITDFGGNYLMGNTSSFFAFISGSERINFERVLYQSQFGGSETGNANQVYIVEAFINFGFWGVFIFSFLVGKFVRLAINSKNTTFISIMPLFLYNLFNTGLIGTLLSNGFLVLFIFVLNTKFEMIDFEALASRNTNESPQLSE